MRPVILGDGLLGSELIKQTGWDYFSRKKDGFDITDTATFNLLLETFQGVGQSAKYDTVVNCIANTDTYSKDRQQHWKVNYEGVANLVDFCNKWSIKLIHMSTDYVYANSTGAPDETDIPVHQETYYAYTKLLADSYIQLRSLDYLIIRATHKPTPFPYTKAWTNQIGNFDYVDIIGKHIIKLVVHSVTGIINVGTEPKSIYDLALKTEPKVEPTLKNSSLIPENTSMNLNRLKNLNL